MFIPLPVIIFLILWMSSCKEEYQVEEPMEYF